MAPQCRETAVEAEPLRPAERRTEDRRINFNQVPYVAQFKSPGSEVSDTLNVVSKNILMYLVWNVQYTFVLGELQLNNGDYSPGTAKFRKFRISN